MASQENSIPSDPTQERFAEAILIVDFHLDKVCQLEQGKGGRK